MNTFDIKTTVYFMTFEFKSFPKLFASKVERKYITEVAPVISSA